MTDDSLNTSNHPINDLSVKQKYYASWVGLVMGLLLPGSAHVLSGQCFRGILWFAGEILMSGVFLGALIFPGKWFFFGVLSSLILYVFYKIVLLISSWRPVRRIGWIGWLIFLLLIFGMSTFVTTPCVRYYNQNVIMAFRTSGMSMAPTFLGPSQQLESPEQADYIIVNKITYRFSEPCRGDIVIYPYQSNSDEESFIFVHRIVGLPGETIDIESPYVLVNGQKLAEPPIFEKISSKQDGFNGYFALSDIGGPSFGDETKLPIILGEDEYFILGDNSEFSLDSRMHGPVKRNDILGRVTYIYYPFSRIGEPE